MLDDTAHILRASLTTDPQCMQFINHKPDQATIDKCNSYLGPSQPGIPHSRPARRRLEPVGGERPRERREAGHPPG
jgi:hypothetical protein